MVRGCRMKKENRKQGISLIVLIVTVIVIIILAAGIMLSLSKNDLIGSANEARFKEDVRTFQDELAITVSKQYVNARGHSDYKISTSNFDEIKEHIPSFSEKYKGKLLIDNDKLKYTSNVDDSEEKWLEALNIKKIYIVPDEYQQVEYIESTGDQFFLLDYLSTSDFGFDIDLFVKNGTGANVFGGYKRNVDNFCYFGLRENKASYFLNANNTDKIVYTSLLYNQKHNYKLINGDYFYDEMKIGTISYTKAENCMLAVFSFVDKNGVVRNASAETFAGRIYKFIIYKGEEQRCNLVPCYRKSDNKPGFFDKINNKFYTNQGDPTKGDFTLGANVN